jgi:6-pyruvoyltetrahydropterin/6-carboxytetrahydropterin synthase
MSIRLSLNGWQLDLTFSAAHLIPHHQKCGRLHGHSYAVNIELEGTPGPEGIVMDFGVIKQALRRILNSLDHRLLVPTRNPGVQIEESEGHIKVTIGSKHYVIPSDDVVLLDIESSTAEHLSHYLLQELITVLQPGDTISKFSLGLDEGLGQGAWSTIEFQTPK